MDYTHLILILFIHFVADFIFQTRTMGRKKSTNIYWLTTHVLAYSIATIMGWSLFLGFENFGIKTLLYIFVATFITHWITDYFTSKLSGYCYLKSLEHKESRKGDFWEWFFWGVIGFDQFIHGLTLVLTYKYLTIIF
jgi:hypothetical protein